MSEEITIDDRSRGDLRSNSGILWRLVSDAVMGGISRGRLEPAVVEGRPCLRLTGAVRLENDGGFLQASLDLAGDGLFDASGCAGVELLVFGNGEIYNAHLRTADTTIVWQSYRASFEAPPRWTTVRLPFSGFAPYRIGTPLDVSRLKRIGLVAIGREFTADLCIGGLGLYRVTP